MLASCTNIQQSSIIKMLFHNKVLDDSCKWFTIKVVCFGCILRAITFSAFFQPQDILVKFLPFITNFPPGRVYIFSWRCFPDVCCSISHNSVNYCIVVVKLFCLLRFSQLLSYIVLHRQILSPAWKESLSKYLFSFSLSKRHFCFFYFLLARCIVISLLAYNKHPYITDGIP